LFVAIGGLSRTLRAQSSDDSARARIVAQALSEFALTPGELKSYSPQGITFEKGPRVGGALEVWRAAIPQDHWHKYLWARSKGVSLALGGFENPELAAASSLLAPTNFDEIAARNLSRKLAVLADWNGAVQFAFWGLSADSGVSREWEARAPASWPHDTVWRSIGGGRIVRLTFFSRATSSYLLGWVPVLYVFNFDSHGLLLAWAKRMGEPFATPKVGLSDTAEPWPH
jgi:hypothetical protein